MFKAFQFHLIQDRAIIAGIKLRSINKLFIVAMLFAAASITAQANTVVNLGTLSLPSTHTFSDSFAPPTVPGTLFKDDYTFTLTANSTLGLIANTVDLAAFQINNLTVLLYSGSGPFVPGTTPLLKVLSTGFNSGGTSGEVVVINPLALSAGSYTLALSGKLDGASGGSYSGSFNVFPLQVSPVPEPGSGLAILSGLALFGIQLRRKSRFRGEAC